MDDAGLCCWKFLEMVTTMPDGPRYDDDFYAWTQHQGMVLRTMAVADNRFDRENVAEEIEDLGRSERDAARSQIRRVIEHLLKLAYSPAERPRFDWMASIAEARAALGDKISPTLRRNAEVMLAKLSGDGRRQAELSLRTYGEHQAAEKLPHSSPYSLDDIFREDWHPAGLEKSHDP
jgi:Domain of unknown function DUF29